MTEWDAMKLIREAAHNRDTAERALTKWIPIAFTRGNSINSIAKTAGLTRSAVYQRLWKAGVKEKEGIGTPGFAVTPRRNQQPEQYRPTKQPDVACAPTCPSCGTETEDGACTNPHCDRWRMAEQFDAVVASDFPAANGHHAFEAARNEFDEPLVICKHCSQWHDAEVHR